ncbi:MAG: peptidoglycan DD-metalloendopeptidase family protein [Alphaproteobacteria bacterium]|nr:peptidoglycan DD-metalloendopeptidase family protein [Alphaproteobacteria bacterium]
MENGKWKIIICMLALMCVPMEANASTKLEKTTETIDKTKQQLKELEDTLKEQRKEGESLDAASKQQENSLANLRKRLIQATDDIAGNQKKIDKLEKQFKGTAAQIAEKMELLGLQRGSVSVVTSAVIDLSLTPKEAYFLQKIPENRLLNQRRIATAILPQLKQKEDIIAKDLSELEALKANLREQKSLLDAAATKLQKQQKEMDSLVEQRQKLLDKTNDKKADIGAKIEELGKHAQDLKELMEKLALEKINEEQRLLEEQKAQERKDAEEAKKAELAKKAATTPKKAPAPKAPAPAKKPAQTAQPIQPPTIVYPLAGKVITNFGQKDKSGIVSDGITMEAKGGSSVIAPSAGKIVFTGPFRGYGNIVIIQHPSNYYSFLSGFGHIGVAVGQEVKQGASLGTLPGTDSKTQRLYFEWRRSDKPLKPVFK